MEKERLLSVTQVAVLVGVVPKTVDIWYRWKRQAPDHELASLLPDYIQDGEKQKRYWRESDVWKMIEFRSKIPKGRNGFFGNVTQKYSRRERMQRHEKENS